MVDHPVCFRGVTLEGGPSAGPVLIDRKDADFLPAIFREFSKAPEPDPNRAQYVPGANYTERDVLTLYQPVQRVMHLGLLEAFCDIPGNPRLDPAKVVSAGIVIRRVPIDGNKKPRFDAPLEAWLKNSDGGVMWKPFHTKDEEDFDPDPAQRKMLSTGQTYLDELLHQTLNGSAFSEATSPAFTAPSDVCKEAQRTLIYALLPLASAELTKPISENKFDDGAFRRHLPVLIKAGNRLTPLAGKQFDANYASPDYLMSKGLQEFKAFLYLLNTMVIELSIFDPGDKNQKLLAEVNKLHVTFSSGHTQQLGEFLRFAKSVLLDKVPVPEPKPGMPVAWPRIDATTEEQIFQKAKEVVVEKLQKSQRQVGRFHNPDRIYRMRAFIRVIHHEHCPPQLIWSKYSQWFKIAPWYDGPGVPTPPVVLPDLTDPNALKKLKPNVSFGIPASLYNLTQGVSLDGLTKGNKPNMAGPALDWICGFNIPIITICAFIVLNIFLQLLNIVFWWLPLLKICIPIPKGTLNSD
jgi:hypothetical protein